MHPHLLRWLARASPITGGVILTYFAAGATVETLAGAGVVARAGRLWDAFHLGWPGIIGMGILLATAAVVSWSARRVLRRQPHMERRLGALASDTSPR